MKNIRKIAAVLATQASCQDLPGVLDHFEHCKNHVHDKARNHKASVLFGGLLISHLAAPEGSGLVFGYEQDTTDAKSLFTLSAKDKPRARLITPRIQDFEMRGPMFTMLKEIACENLQPRGPRESRSHKLEKGCYDLPSDLFGLIDPFEVRWFRVT